MATTTIHSETLATSALGADEILFWSVAGGYQRRITKTNFFGGTMALLETTNAFSALNTFSAGINLGQTQNLSYYNGDNWTPVVADAASGGNVASLGSSFGVYQRFGLTVNISGWVGDINTSGLTAGNALYIRGLPFVSLSAGNYYSIGNCNASNVTWTGYLVPYIGSNMSALNIAKNTTGANAANLIVSNFTSGTADIAFSLTYFCAP